MISEAVPVLRVRTDDGREFRFSRPFHVGRSADCDIQIEDAHVSRVHLLVSFDQDQWSFRDLQSANGVFVGAERVEIGTVQGRLAIQLGIEGPSLIIEMEQPASRTRGGQSRVEESPRYNGVTGDEPGGEAMALDHYAERYFGWTGSDEPVGERTMMIRRAFQKVHQQQRRRYIWAVAVLAVAGAIAGGYAYYGHVQLRQQEGLAEDLFYTMKALDVQIAGLEQLLAAAPAGQQGQHQLQAFRDQRSGAEAQYDDFLSRTTLGGRRLTEEERLILRVTRKFGECEVMAPRDYLAEVAAYIQKWRATGRFAKDLMVAQQNGYTRTILEELAAQHLPQEFFYLAMQESDFKPDNVGPWTRWGYAKGMWQFIPGTAKDYGLRVGPLAGGSHFDPQDDRFRWEKATKAAAHYIKDIYTTDAQASGLLVIASYNWGEKRVIDLVRQLPPNPRERNFWKLLERFGNKVPQQTYDYVFSIVSAAVIGENPRLFGFSFDNPLNTRG